MPIITVAQESQIKDCAFKINVTSFIFVQISLTPNMPVITCAVRFKTAFLLIIMFFKINDFFMPLQHFKMHKVPSFAYCPSPSKCSPSGSLEREIPCQETLCTIKARIRLLCTVPPGMTMNLISMMQ